MQEFASSSASQPIPILAPPPAPLNIVPSRARRQLAARLALHKKQADSATDTFNDPSSNEGEVHHNDDHWQSNPFIIAGLEDDSQEMGSSEFSAMDEEDHPTSPTFHTGFTPPGSPSTNSSDDAGGDPQETIRRKVRVPLEVDDDDDEMGEIVGPGSGSGSGGILDSDEEEEAIINESLGYSNFFGSSRYGGFSRAYGRKGQSSFDEEDDEDNDSSDGEDGLVEILVPGRSKSFSSN